MIGCRETASDLLASMLAEAQSDDKGKDKTTRVKNHVDISGTVVQYSRMDTIATLVSLVFGHQDLLGMMSV
jgi:hypothetical protein